MTKKERLKNILNGLTVEERSIINNLPRKIINVILDQEGDNQLLITLFKKLIKEKKLTISKIEEEREAKKEKVKKEKVKKEKVKKEKKEVTIKHIPIIEEDLLKEALNIKEDLIRSYNIIEVYKDIKEKKEEENKELKKKINFLESYNYYVNDYLYNIEAMGYVSDMYALKLAYYSKRMLVYFPIIEELKNKVEKNNRVIDYITISFKEAKKKTYKLISRMKKDLLFWQEEGLLNTYKYKEALYKNIIQDLLGIGKSRKEENYKVVSAVELYIPKVGMIPIEKELIEYLSKIFNYSFDTMKRKITNMFMRYPKKSPITNLNIFLDYRVFNYLLLDSIEDYLLNNDKKEKDYNLFLSLYSKNVYSLFKDLGIFTNRITKQEKEKIVKEKPCYIYRKNIEEKVTELTVIYPTRNKKEYTHKIDFLASYEEEEEKREKEEEEKEEELLQENL